MVQMSGASVSTCTSDPSTWFDVLTRPPKRVSAAVRSHRSPLVVTMAGPKIGSRPHVGLIRDGSCRRVCDP